MSDNPDCKECYAMLTKIEASVDRISNDVKGMMMKMLYAIIAFGGANVASKFFGTPIHVELAMYTLSGAAIFVLLVTIWKRKCLSFFESWVRYCFVTYAIWVTGLRIYHYNAGTPLTQNEGVVSQLLLFVMAVGFLLNAWRRDALRESKKRRWNDNYGG